MCRDFLSQSSENNVAIVIDPPFGGLADVLARSISKLWSMADRGIVTSRVSISISHVPSHKIM